MRVCIHVTDLGLEEGDKLVRLCLCIEHDNSSDNLKRGGGGDKGKERGRGEEEEMTTVHLINNINSLLHIIPCLTNPNITLVQASHLVGESKDLTTNS